MNEQSILDSPNIDGNRQHIERIAMADVRVCPSGYYRDLIGRCRQPFLKNPLR